MTTLKRKTTKKHGENGKLEHDPIPRNRRHKSKLGHVPISDLITYRPLSEIQPSPKNDKLYKPVDTTDPDFKALAENVRTNGVRKALIVSRDGYIVSGHRRYAAAGIAGLELIPCREADIDHDDPRFLVLLRDCNRQRVKAFDEVLREEVVSADPEEAHRRLVDISQTASHGGSGHHHVGLRQASRSHH